MSRYIPRPTIGNTYAIGRFSPGGPTDYVAVYDDGTHGPKRTTRAEAEADYTTHQEATAERHHYGEYCDCPECIGTLPAMLRDTKRYRDALRHAFRTEALTDWDACHGIAQELMRRYEPATFARLDTIAYRYA